MSINDDDEGRECTKCHEWKVWGEYGKKKNGRNGRGSKCRGCMREYMKEYYAERRKVDRAEPKYLITDEGRECTSCEEFKVWDEFYKQKAGRNGRTPRCRECARAATAEYNARPEVRAAKAEYRKEYRKRPEVKAAEAEYAKEYYARPEVKAAKAEYMKEYLKEYRTRPEVKARQAEYMKEYLKEYYARPEVKAAKAEYMKEYQAANPHVKWESGYRRRCKRLGLAPVVEDFTKDDVIAKYGDHCFYCENGAFEHLDHYIPVKENGAHTVENVRPSCAACNLGKSDLSPEEWLAEQQANDSLTEEELEAAIDDEISRWLDEGETHDHSVVNIAITRRPNNDTKNDTDNQEAS